MGQLIELPAGSSEYRDRIAGLEAEQAKQGAYYDVIVEPAIYKHDGEIKEVPNKVALVNGSTGKFISQMSKGYKVVSNKETLGTLNAHLARSDIDLTGAYSKVRVGYNGGRTAVNYVFPAHKIETAPGDYTYLSLLFINSFDGSTSLISSFGGLRGYCLNTQVFGEMVSFKKLHNNSLDFDDVAETVTRGLEVFLKEGDAWKRMLETQIDYYKAVAAILKWFKIDPVVDDTFGSMSFSYENFASNYIRAAANNEMKMPPKVETALGIWNKYVEEFGHNEFALYNTLTHLAEHGALKSGNRPQALGTIQKRHSAVRAISNQYLTQYAA